MTCDLTWLDVWPNDLWLDLDLQGNDLWLDLDLQKMTCCHLWVPLNMVIGFHWTWWLGSTGHGDWVPLDMVVGFHWTWWLGSTGHGDWVGTTSSPLADHSAHRTSCMAAWPHELQQYQTLWYYKYIENPSLQSITTFIISTADSHTRIKLSPRGHIYFNKSQPLRTQLISYLAKFYSQTPSKIHKVHSFLSSNTASLDLQNRTIYTLITQSTSQITTVGL